MRAWMIVSFVFATGCAIEAGSSDGRVGPDGQPVGAADLSTANAEGAGSAAAAGRAVAKVITKIRLAIRTVSAPFTGFGKDD